MKTYNFLQKKFFSHLSEFVDKNHFIVILELSLFLQAYNLWNKT